ncbi:putative R3H domain-containing protein 1 isoform X9 [Sesbania bispinosa]|nr:putative R3H domain-containing protein 1 isoform X9 [Sesbania bispinosa]
MADMQDRRALVAAAQPNRWRGLAVQPPLCTVAHFPRNASCRRHTIGLLCACIARPPRAQVSCVTSYRISWLRHHQPKPHRPPSPIDTVTRCCKWLKLHHHCDAQLVSCHHPTFFFHLPFHRDVLLQLYRNMRPSGSSNE